MTDEDRQYEHFKQHMFPKWLLKLAKQRTRKDHFELPAYLYSLGREGDWLDHHGTAIIDGEEVLISEPYHLYPESKEALGRFCRKFDSTFEVKERGSTYLIIVSRKRNVSRVSGPPGPAVELPNSGLTEAVHLDPRNHSIATTAYHAKYYAHDLTRRAPGGMDRLSTALFDAAVDLNLDTWFEKQGYSSKDSEFDLIYVNGGNNLENLKAPDDTWKVRMIEEDFHRLMFDVEDV